MTMRRGGCALEPPTAWSAGRPAVDRIEHVDAQAREARRARGEAAGVTTFGGPSTSSRASFVQRATTSARAAISA